MNEFMAYITRCILVDGQEAINIFPGQAGVSVVKAYAERLASDVVSSLGRDGGIVLFNGVI